MRELDRGYDPSAELEARGITVALARLPTRGAWWVPDEAVVLLDDRLSPQARRCALAHELEHAVAGDRPTAWPVSARIEHARNRSAARRLIPLSALIDASRWSADPRELAEELDVDLPTLLVRLRALTPGEAALVAEVASTSG